PKRRAADETLASIAKSYAVDISMISHAGVNFGGEGQPLDCEIVVEPPILGIRKARCSRKTLIRLGSKFFHDRHGVP
ncbi:MAG: hypothetical protein WBL84_00235, partial [Xanthobacteraceae bacterium]